MLNNKKYKLLNNNKLNNFFLVYIKYFLADFTHNGHLIEIVMDYECVTCHRIFQNKDVRNINFYCF